jgi:hypothetical protein
MPLVEAIFVRADSDITTLEDLRGQPMVDGYTAQQTIMPQLDAIYATAGMTRADMVPVNVARSRRGPMPSSRARPSASSSPTAPARCARRTRRWAACARWASSR